VILLALRGRLWHTRIGLVVWWLLLAQVAEGGHADLHKRDAVRCARRRVTDHRKRLSIASIMCNAHRIARWRVRMSNAQRAHSRRTRSALRMC
jgi:hypothetical protein